MIRAARRPFEGLTAHGETAAGPGESCKSHPRLGGIVDVVRQCTGRTGQHALQPVAGEVAGLVARLDVGYTDPDTVGDVRELDRFDRTDLHALAALDAGGEKFLLVEPILERARWAQTRVRLADQRDEPGERGPDHPDEEGGAAQKLTSSLISQLLGFAPWLGFRLGSGCVFHRRSTSQSRPSERRSAS